MHPLSNATTFQLALAVETLVAVRHSLQLHASLAALMPGAVSSYQAWVEARRDEVDAHIVEAARAAIYHEDRSDDAAADREQINTSAGAILREKCDLIDVQDLIANHREALAANRLVDTDETSAALAAAAYALLTFRPVTMDQAAARSTYMLGGDFLDASRWGEGEITALLRSMSHADTVRASQARTVAGIAGNPVFDAIAAHARAFADLAAWSQRVDEVAAQSQGRDVTPEDQSAWKRASAVEDQTRRAVCAVSHSNPVELRAKVAYINVIRTQMGEMDPADYDALLARFLDR